MRRRMLAGFALALTVGVGTATWAQRREPNPPTNQPTLAEQGQDDFIAVGKHFVNRHRIDYVESVAKEGPAVGDEPQDGFLVYVGGRRDPIKVTGRDTTTLMRAIAPDRR